MTDGGGPGAGEIPVRYGFVTAEALRCPTCGRPLAPGRRRYCADACRQAAYRRRLAAASAPAPAARAPKAETIYQCPSCEERYVGEQRCEDCNVFCRRLGVGGCCPHCDRPVAVRDLLEG